ncbi:MAG TPA: hypothetical protein VMK65_03485 [Longimicrobiales bacterium]|nr:hypothetical protein [Longimicrobiales bacterium]
MSRAPRGATGGVFGLPAVPHLLLAVALLALSACRGEDPVRACTQIGCSDGLTVEVTGDVPSRYTVRVVPEGAQATEQACGDGMPCAGGAFFPDLTPERATVQVLVDDEVVAELTVTPVYDDVQPNGAGCPPICRQARVTVAVG